MPLFFAGQILEYQLLTSTFFAFIAFSLGAFSIYIFNDIQDLNEDRLHPIKKYRAIASGRIKRTHAIYLMSLLFAVSLLTMKLLSNQAFLFLLAYLLMNIAYSLFLKKIAIIDVSIIATGFILRLFVGSSVSNVSLSVWIIILTFLLSFFIALAKRRDDLVIFNKTGIILRSSITFYNLKKLDLALVFIAIITSIVYFLYTISPEIISRLHTNQLYLSSIFVVAGLIRYLHITIKQNNSGSPIKIIFTDLIIQLILIGWIIFFTWVIY
jgi:4-hydroxybenzoate polyprenyltransferase